MATSMIATVHTITATVKVHNGLSYIAVLVFMMQYTFLW